MIDRTIEFPKRHSFFLFGARGTGKTWLLRKRFPKALYVDLLAPQDWNELSLRPSALSERISQLGKGFHWVIIDEVQRAPELLNIVHLEIEAQSRSRNGVTNERPKNREIAFAITGSSARKLKRGQANLLAGRAFLENLYPFTHRELGDRFDLRKILEWGALPGVVMAEKRDDRARLLNAYVQTYLREEIAAEQIVRQLPPYRRFLEAAAQCNGLIVNFSKLARDIGVTTQTVQGYFQTLEDTLLAIRLDPFHESIRKRQRANPKYYIFDTGVQRAMSGLLQIALVPKTYAFGRAFEHFLILEIMRLASYGSKDFRFSYLTTKDGAEIDLIIERPGAPRALIEIKSSNRVTEDDIRHLSRFHCDMKNTEAYCLSMDPNPKVINGVHVLPWKNGLEEIGV